MGLSLLFVLFLCSLLMLSKHHPAAYHLRHSVPRSFPRSLSPSFDCFLGPCQVAAAAGALDAIQQIADIVQRATVSAPVCGPLNIGQQTPSPDAAAIGRSFQLSADSASLLEAFYSLL